MVNKFGNQYSLGKEIRKLRKNLSREEFVAGLNEYCPDIRISTGILERIENGTKIPNDELLRLIAVYGGKDDSYFFQSNSYQKISGVKELIEIMPRALSEIQEMTHRSNELDKAIAQIDSLYELLHGALPNVGHRATKEKLLEFSAWLLVAKADAYTFYLSRDVAARYQNDMSKMLEQLSFKAERPVIGYLARLILAFSAYSIGNYKAVCDYLSVLPNHHTAKGHYIQPFGRYAPPFWVVMSLRFQVLSAAHLGNWRTGKSSLDNLNDFLNQGHIPEYANFLGIETLARFYGIQKDSAAMGLLEDATVYRLQCYRTLRLAELRSGLEILHHSDKPNKEIARISLEEITRITKQSQWFVGQAHNLSRRMGVHGT